MFAGHGATSRSTVGQQVASPHAYRTPVTLSASEAGGGVVKTVALAHAAVRWPSPSSGFCGLSAAGSQRDPSYLRERERAVAA